MTLSSKINRFSEDADIAHDIVHGDDKTIVQTEGGPVRTFAKIVADIESASDAAISEFQNAGGELTMAAEAARDEARQAQADTEKARDDAVAVVYEGEGSLEPSPGSIPVARADGTIDPGWLPDHLMIRPNRIDKDITIPDGHNALLVGPVEIGPNVTITGLGNSTLRGI